MATVEKPRSITITLGDRKEKKYRSFVVYGDALEQVEKRIKNCLK